MKLRAEILQVENLDILYIINDLKNKLICKFRYNLLYVKICSISDILHIAYRPIFAFKKSSKISTNKMYAYFYALFLQCGISVVLF